MKNPLFGKIVQDPEICGGEPVIKGTRVRLKIIFDNLAAGISPEEIVKSYPTLSLADVRAVIAFAAAAASDDLSLPIQSMSLETNEN